MLTLKTALPFSERQLALSLLSNTYPAYHDRGSRKAVQDCLQLLLTTDPDCLSDFRTFLTTEAAKPGISPSNAFVLIEWCSLSLQVCATDIKIWRMHGLDIISATAQLLELCVSLDVRRSVKQSALVSIRRGLRKIFKSLEDGGHAIEAIVSRLTQKGGFGYRSSILLGIVAGVCARLEAAKPILEGLKTEYFAFWTREIISSRTVVPSHVANSFYDYFSNYTSIEDLQTEIIPALEKALLRAPEVVLNDLIKPMITALSSHIDLSESLAYHLLKPLLSNIKSTNLNIRNGAYSAFAVLVDHCHNGEMLEKIGHDILTPLSTSKIASVDQRILHARMLSSLPSHTKLSMSICEGLSTVISKEPNEAAAAAEGSAFVHHLTFMILHDGPTGGKQFTPIFVNGLGDKRTGFQRLWALQLGELLLQLSESSCQTHGVRDIVEAILPKLLDVFHDVANNPLPAAQSGLVVAGYITASLYGFFSEIVTSAALKTMLQKAKVIQTSLIVGTKPSFLLNAKVYTKLTSHDDLSWLVRAILACSSEIVLLNGGVAATAASAAAWTQVLLYTTMASSVEPDVRRQALEGLTRAYIRYPGEIARLVVDGLWSWHWNIETAVKDSAALAAHTGSRRSHLVLRSICLSPHVQNQLGCAINVELLQLQLVNMLVLCRAEILPRVNWIEMCLSVGQDPGSLIKMHNTRCIEKVNSILDYHIHEAPSVTVKLAAYRTFAELAFVAPDAITPILVDQITADLSVEDLRQYGPTDFAIARTPEGTTFVDVLTVKAQNKVLDKSTRDYDTLKWEEDVRMQLALKKGQQKKLSMEEQNKVNAQLAKEAKIRQRVLQLQQKLERGIGIIRALATGPPTDADMWMGPSLRALLDIIEAGVGLLLGEAAEKVYIECANFMSSRVGTLKSFIGIATLRALGSSHLPCELVQESLGGS